MDIQGERNPTLPVKIDEWLRIVRDTGAIDANLGGEDWSVSDDRIKATKTALLEAFREAVVEMVGNDEPLHVAFRPQDELEGVTRGLIAGRNELREELRHRLNQILGESNG